MAQPGTEPPIVGITSYGRDEKRRFRVSVDYVDAVRRAGGLPIILPPGEPAIDVLFAHLDALVLSGGGDLAPERYGGAGHPTVYNVDPERDAFELALVRRIVRTGRPALCICRGSQVLNVALGGSLVAHLPDVVGDTLAHREPDPDGPAGETRPVRHGVSVCPDTHLRRILGVDHGEPASWHHQAVQQVAPGLEVAATAEDGTIEAVEMPEHPWLVGVQWHPEITAAQDPVQQRLFDALVAAARIERVGRIAARG
jgi:putative glutamine amidotransferase